MKTLSELKLAVEEYARNLANTHGLLLPDQNLEVTLELTPRQLVSISDLGLPSYIVKRLKEEAKINTLQDLLKRLVLFKTRKSYGEYELAYFPMNGYHWDNGEAWLLGSWGPKKAEIVIKALNEKGYQLKRFESRNEMNKIFKATKAQYHQPL